METIEETKERIYKPGNVIRHTDSPGERNPLPKLPENLRLKGYERRGDTNEFIKYIVDDPDAPQPTIEELPPSDKPLFKTKEEADKYRANHPEEKKEDDDPTSVWRWTDYDKD